MTPMLLLLLFPFVTIVGMKIWRSENFSWLEAGTQALLSIVLITGGYYGGKALEMSSVEFWTGTIKSKTHVDGHYTTSYCCATDKDGNCTSTCYEDHYTRDWYLKTTVGKITTSNIDTTSRSRRNGFKSDSHWNDAYKGEACSITNVYTNYVAAAESSLHHRSGSKEAWLKTGLLPNYPQIHGKYHLQRVHDLGVGVPNLKAWNKTLDDYMGKLGALKQINILVYFVPTLDASYKHALEAHWRGANKNDTIVIIGSEKGSNVIGAVDVITWAKSDIYRKTIIDSLMGLKNIDENAFGPALQSINEATMSLYERRPMAEFEHLAKEIDPPTWVMVLLIIIAIPGSLLMAYIFDRIDLDAKVFGRSGYRRRSSGIRFRNRRF